MVAPVGRVELLEAGPASPTEPPTYPKTVVTITNATYEDAGCQYTLTLPDGRTALIGDAQDDYGTLASIIDRAFGDEAETAAPEPAEQTWTFFGHYNDADELVIEHAVKGEHEDTREDDGTHAGGLWADSGTGATQAEAEADARSEYEH